MRTNFTLILAAILTLTLGASKVCTGQIVAIGHVSAEVIESVSAASNAVTSFELAAITERKANEQSYQNSENINLGAITLFSGKDVTCNVVVKSASLSDSVGNGFTLETSIKNNTFASVAQSNGSQTIQLDGKANLGGSQASGLYQGSYTVVFAYN